MKVILVTGGSDPKDKIMFNQSKYTYWYYIIINYRRENPLDDSSYGEKHHIIPKSLGGTNKKENIVKLTAREHYICHRLLVKMTEGKDKAKMSYAIRNLINQQNPHQTRQKVSSKIYDLIIKDTKKSIGNVQRGVNNPYYGKKHTKEIRDRMKVKRANQPPPMLGKNHSIDTKEKLREANRKQFEDPYQIELRRKVCNKIKGMKIYHNIEGNTKYYFEGMQPIGWTKGRPKKKGGGNND